jgi:type IV fimbrial biogenesis protein FimT
MSSFLRDNAIVALTNELVADLQFARSEAIKRNQPVSVCRANASFNGCGADANWENGWIVFEETAGNANGAVDAGEDIIRRHNGTSVGGATIRVVDAANLDTELVFQSDGVPVSETGQSLRGTFRICDNGDTDSARGVIIARSGNVRAQRGGFASCS